MCPARTAALLVKPADGVFQRLETDFGMRDFQYIQQHEELARPFQVTQHLRCIAYDGHLLGNIVQELGGGFKTAAIDKAGNVVGIETLYGADKGIPVKMAMGVWNAENLAGFLRGIPVGECIQRDDMVSGLSRRLDERPCGDGRNDDGFNGSAFSG